MESCPFKTDVLSSSGERERERESEKQFHPFFKDNENVIPGGRGGG